MRDGPRTRNGHLERGSRSRTGRHAAKVLVERALHPAALRLCDGRHDPVATVRSDHRTRFRAVAAASAGHSGGALGRLALLHPRAAISPNHEPQHVHPDRLRRCHRLSVQPCGNPRPGHLSRGFPRSCGPGRRLLRGSSGYHDPRAARAGARTQGARIHIERLAGASRARAPDRDEDFRSRGRARSSA